MRFLCLHGMGTSSEIFEVQTAAIRYGIGDHHTYDYVEGLIPHPMAPGLSALISPDTECFTYADGDSVESCTQALIDLDEYVEDNGPYDGVMAFSNGAGLAATLLILQERKQSTQLSAPPLFKCAIFFCGGVPADPNDMLERKELRRLTPEDGVKIRIPTAHIWGRNDMLYPTFGPVLRSLCKKNLREEYVHNGGHDIPSSDKVAVANSVRVIKKTIDKALEG